MWSGSPLHAPENDNPPVLFTLRVQEGSQKYCGGVCVAG